MRISINPAALEELNEASLRYESERPGLGAEFFTEIVRLLDEISETPKRWPMLSARARRHRSVRFPYAVVYYVYRDEIRVVAIMHGARRRGYWKSRD